MHGRYLLNQSGEPGWQAAFGSRENQLHEEVRKGRLISTSGNTARQENEPPSSPLGGSESPHREWTPCKTCSRNGRRPGRTEARLCRSVDINELARGDGSSLAGTVADFFTSDMSKC